MKTGSFYLLAVVTGLLCTVVGCRSGVDSRGERPEIDYAEIRGFNYTPAGVPQPSHVQSWVQYDEQTTVFDMDLAKKLNLNQARVFVNYAAYTELGDELANRLRHFVRTCHERGIGVTPVVGNGPWVADTTQRAEGRAWVEFLVNALADEPGLAMWDVMNEPDYGARGSEERLARNFDNCKFMSELFHELDPQTPVTIGMAFVWGMKAMADYVDVLQFHDYSYTRKGVQDTLKLAKEFAALAGKPLINGEMGCVARANPYDVVLEEYTGSGVGWYIWELMIVRQGWGSIHGVFYEDGTVRDPSIAAAILGYFRNRGDILPEIPDREGLLTKTTNNLNTLLAQSAPEWEESLTQLEIAANLMESGQIAAMNVPPSWEVIQLRKGEPDVAALKALMRKFIGIMTPYMNQE
ncbi:MAG: hypothetical protein LBM20_00825 [Rikenellaceae bacterium]|jgi:hypothetical protein|nr:hypothetical protein [Rikenellaceae bacterium]